MKTVPFTFDISIADEILSEYDNHIERRLSAMKGQFLDTQAYETMLTEDDTLLYEVYEIKRPEIAGELLNGAFDRAPGHSGP